MALLAVFLQGVMVPGTFAETVTTLPPDTTTSVDLREQQHEAERAAARRRAEIAASLPGAAEREAIVPEILLLQREVLPRLVVVASHPAGATQSWRLKSATPPPIYAERVITYLLLAGFSTTPPCAGAEWSGTHGQSRVAVRVEARNVVVLLGHKDAACAATP